MFEPGGVVADSWCYTEVASSKFTFIWTINDFNCALPSLKSPMFSSSGFADSAKSQQCQVCLERDRDMKHADLSIILEPRTVRDAVVHFKFSLLEYNGEEVETKEDSFIIQKSAPWKSTTKRVHFHKSTISDVLFDGMLKIYCVVLNTGDAKHISGSSNFTVSPCDLGTCLEAVQSEGLWTDFILAVGEKEIKVHRIILAARSPVFQRMIKSPMAERNSSRVEITDFKEDVVEEMVHFMYTGEAPNLQGMPEALLTIADKYELKRLKEMCEKALSNCLNVNNAATTLALAEQCNADQLKRICFDFISAHVSEVVQTPGWEPLKSHRTLFGELLRSFARITLPSEVWEDIDTSIVTQRATQQD